MARSGWSLPRRALRQLRGWLGRPQAGFVHDPGYLPRAAAVLPIDTQRGERVLAWLVHEGYLRPGAVVRPRPSGMNDLRRVHTDAYLASLADPAVVSAIFGAPLTPAEAETVLEAQRLAAGGTAHAVRWALLSGMPVLNLGGGFHHAEPGRGLGFCVYNDVAAAIARLRAWRWGGRVLVVDLDLHDGNGVRAAFAQDPSVFTLSIHNQTWNDAPALAARTIALGTGVDDARFLAALHDELPAVVAGHRPDLVVYVAGTDGAADDQMGDWHLSPDGILARDRFVVEELRRQRPDAALAVVLAGGYGRLAWRYTARFAAWLLSGAVVELPDDSEVVLERFRRARAALAATGDPPSADHGPGWTLTPSDLGGLGAPPSPPRFLGRYAVHGLELLLERTGFLEEVRARGYPDPVVQIGTTASGDTLRILGDRDGDLLMELIARCDATLVPGLGVLYVEWLLLQDPRARFRPGRTPLPGQHHPGLGLLREASALLQLLAEDLGLAGVAFVPSHYWMAALGRKVLRFLRPGDEARFLAMAEALGGRPLLEASRLLGEGRVRDARGGDPVVWEPKPMVIPVGEALGALVEGPGRDAEVARMRPTFVLAATSEPVDPLAPGE